MTHMLFLFFFSEIDLYTDPCEQVEQASGYENKDIYSSGNTHTP